jgi:hypothetical protein
MKAATSRRQVASSSATACRSPSGFSSESLQLIRELPRRRHHRAADENRDDVVRPRERRRELRAHVVVRLEQPSRALGACRSQPARPDHGEDDVGLFERVVDRRAEVLPRPDRSDVLEDVPLAELRGQRVVQSSRPRGRILAAIAEEDPNRPLPAEDRTRRPRRPTSSSTRA